MKLKNMVRAAAVAATVAVLGTTFAAQSAAGAPRPGENRSAAPVGDRMTAVAASGWDRCQDGFSCFFEDKFGEGEMWMAPGTGCFNLGQTNPPFNDRISSALNLGGDVVHMYNWQDGWHWEADVQVGRSAAWNTDAGQPGQDNIDMVCTGSNTP